MTPSIKNSASKMGQNKFLIGPDETVLVTGANGFIGLQVVRTLLSYGFENIRCLIRSPSKSMQLKELVLEFGHDKLEIISGNLLSVDDCLRASKGASVIYHLAAGVGKSYADCFLNSVVTTRNLLEAIIKGGALKRFVNISSIAVYSNEKIRSGGLFDETIEIETELVERYEPYTYGKTKQDELVTAYAEQYGIPYVIVRPSLVFGPGKAKISSRIGTSTFGLFLHLGLRNRIPFTYVDNCAEAIVLAGMKRGIDGQVFNIFDDDLPRSRDFLKLYKCKVRSFFSIPVPHWLWRRFCCLWERYSKWSEGQLPPVFNRRSFSIYWKDHEYTNKKAKQLLGWHPRVPMNEALDNFFCYMREKEVLK